ncbi:hypothetical protein [Paenibacillus gorillae]|uniref:hypothetical protein n=1 Tax=Paenibacillus gorillae TaxID=1243662 RepID=UPI0012DEA5DC|nr:hypothetical protein [Paenibacillus gorillae]
MSNGSVVQQLKQQTMHSPRDNNTSGEPAAYHAAIRATTRAAIRRQIVRQLEL